MLGRGRFLFCGEGHRVNRLDKKTAGTVSPKAFRGHAPARLGQARCSREGGYRWAIARACEKAEVPPWHPHQLCHNCATKVRCLYGLDGASAVLGHKIGIVTEIYAEQDFQKAINIMREIG